MCKKLILAYIIFPLLAAAAVSADEYGSGSYGEGVYGTDSSAGQYTGSSGSGFSQTDNTVFTRVLSNIVPDNTYVLNIGKNDIAVKQISMHFHVSIGESKITLKKVYNISGNFTAYQYLEIKADGTRDSDIKYVMVRFNVTKDWLVQGGFGVGDVYLQRLSSIWKKLDTLIISESEDEVEYESVSPGFSFYAITAEKKYEPVQAPPEKPFQPPDSLPVQNPESDIIADESVSLDAVNILLTAAILVVIGLLYVRTMPKRKHRSRKKAKK
jgi:PGF-pre-PGF domain-containing protein